MFHCANVDELGRWNDAENRLGDAHPTQVGIRDEEDPRCLGGELLTWLQKKQSLMRGSPSAHERRSVRELGP